MRKKQQPSGQEDLQIIDGKVVWSPLDTVHALVPGGVTEIGRYAFLRRGKLETVSLPDGLVRIGEEAFSHCESLREIRLPDTVREIGEGAFESCGSLEAIEVPAGIEVLEGSTFRFCEGLKEVRLPEGLLVIGRNAFDHCSSLESIVLPDSVRSIGPEAFACCALTGIRLPEGLESLGDSVFTDCRALTGLRVPASVTEMGMNIWPPYAVCGSPSAAARVEYPAYPGGGPGDLPEDIRPAALKGWLWGLRQGMEGLKAWEEDYLDEIRTHLKRYSGEGLGDKDILFFMLDHGLFDPETYAMIREDIPRIEDLEIRAALIALGKETGAGPEDLDI